MTNRASCPQWASRLRRALLLFQEFQNSCALFESRRLPAGEPICHNLGRSPRQFGQALSVRGEQTGRPFYPVAYKKKKSRSGHLDVFRCQPGESSIGLSSKFVSEVLLCFGEIELVDQVIFASAALLELAD
jgi:hypothetical protein